MYNFVIFGAPGSGKGTQSKKISDTYGLFHISTGDLLRNHIKNGTEHGKVAEQYINRGQLIPDELMIKILKDHILTNPDSKKGVIFDGFPRTLEQAHQLEELLEELGTQLHAVIGLEVEEDLLIDRLIKRGQTSGRKDDNPDTIKNRLNVYHSSTLPLKNFYTREGKFHPIEGNSGIDEIFESITNRINHIMRND